MLYLSELQISPMIENLGYATGGGLSSSAKTSHPMQRTIKQVFRRLSDAKIKGDSSLEITALITDSRRIVPGSVFFARDGRRTDGNFYIEEAIDRGAAAIVSTRPPGLHASIVWIQVADVPVALASAAREFYHQPDESLRVIGITGTNGKTTVTSLVQHLLSAERRKIGLIGTVHYDLGGRTIPSFKTTPESVDTLAMLSQMRTAGCEGVVMEVSSHGIEQHRVDGLHLELAAFLNLTQDHLDYHQSMDAYFETKASLFTGQVGNLPSVAVINVDDPWGRRLRERIPGDVKVITVGEDPGADFQASDIALRLGNTRFRLRTPTGEHEVRSPLLGRYNVSNVLVAFALASAYGVDLDELVLRLETFPGVPGRMEPVDEGQDFGVLVDYAHTDDALRNTLAMLREVVRDRILVVFGCGGDRDRAKRLLMMEAAESGADLVWATTDNPRSEDPGRIFDDMRSGMRDGSKVRFIEDRRTAIGAALGQARPGDVVLIAGKGHETFQELADTAVPFDDRQVAREMLRLKFDLA